MSAEKKKIAAFSGGMKQRLGIAAAIMENPDIIILDEPINALDDTGTEQIRDILIRHRERGALIIIACHDADELNFLSDEIIEIVQGQIKPSKDDKKQIDAFPRGVQRYLSKKTTAIKYQTMRKASVVF